MTQPSKQPALPGSTDDAADFYGLAGALVAIVVVIFVVRRIVPLRRQPAEGRHPTQPAEGRHPTQPAEGRRTPPAEASGARPESREQG